MYKSFFDSQGYQSVMYRHIHEMVSLLLKEDVEFGIACDTSNISFLPELPSSIRDNFGERIFFILAEYSHESAHIKNNSLLFEAGFGDENFGSIVSIPLLAIQQIMVEDNPILINFSSYEKYSEPTKEAPTNSMEALLKNPKNKSLLAKKRHF